MLRDDPLPEPPSSDLWVRFVNTLAFDHGRPLDFIAEAPALLAWLRTEHLISERAASAERARLRDDADEAERRLERFRYLRDLVRAMAEEAALSGQPNRAQVRELNHVLRHGLHYHQLELSPEGNRYGLARVGDRLDQARAAVAGSLADFLAGGPVHRLRVCANPGCREVFIDRSPTGRRRWCAMRTCGNQAKVARHRARYRQASVAPALPAAAGAH